MTLMLLHCIAMNADDNCCQFVFSV